MADTWRSKGTDLSVSGRTALRFLYFFNLQHSNTKGNAPFQKKKLDEFILYSFELCKAMCLSIHHYFLSVDTISHELAFF